MAGDPDAWRAYRGAPHPGQEICRLSDIPEDNALCLCVDGFPLLLLRSPDGVVRAYVNACPHQFLPLNQRGSRLLSADGKTLRCTNHDAAFDPASGIGTGGLGKGACLDPVPVALRHRTIVIAES